MNIRSKVKAYDYLDGRSLMYRIEYATIALLLISYLSWRWLYLGLDLPQTIFWFLFPEVSQGILILGIFLLGTLPKEWPGWRCNFWNFFHTFTVGGLVFGIFSLAIGSLYWPLLGWLVNISVIRSAGLGLVKPKQSRTSSLVD